MIRALLLVVWLAACGSAPPPSDAAQCTMLLEERLGVPLPPGTVVLGVEVERGLDDAVFAKLQIPLRELWAFQAATGIESFREGGADLLGPDHNLWDPHQAKSLATGSTPLPNSRNLIVAIDASHAEQAVVYAVNHGS